MPRLQPVRGNLFASFAPLRLATFGLIFGALANFGCKKEPASEPAVPDVAVQPPVAVPSLRQHIYPENTDPNADIAAAVKQATAEHKNIILDFGGDWCGDCHVLDLYLHQPPNGDLLAKDYVLVHVFIGHMDRNMEIPARYGVPVSRGVPALAVLNSHGKLIFAQQHKEFEKDLEPGEVTDFLNKWKA